MTDQPRIFNGPMVRALLARRKTMTRRVLKPQPPRREHFGRDIMDWGLSGIYQDELNTGPSKWWLDVQTDVDDNSHQEIDVRFAVGDRLWVREACRAERLELSAYGPKGVRYIADGAWLPIKYYAAARDAWLSLANYRGNVGQIVGQIVPPIHAPRWTSRISLDVDAVKIERLQDISEEDALAEGVEFAPPGTAREAFARLWRSIHGADAWDANPWVVAPSFRVVEVRS